MDAAAIRVLSFACQLAPPPPGRWGLTQLRGTGLIHTIAEPRLHLVKACPGQAICVPGPPELAVLFLDIASS
jgi:hypothetical protein